MRKAYDDKAKSFRIDDEAWYANQGGARDRCITIGFYYKDGTEGEFRIAWEPVGMRLMAYSDAWEALTKMPELLELMAKIDREGAEPSVEEFACMLTEIGYKDITEREKYISGHGNGEIVER